MTVSEALEAIKEVYNVGFSKVSEELYEKAESWDKGSINSFLVYDEESKVVSVIKEETSTFTPSFVYLFGVSGSDKLNLDEESIFDDLMETDFEEPFIKRLDLSEEQEAGFRYLFKLFLFRVGTKRKGLPETNWKDWSGLDADACMIEEWGICDLLNPAREITKEDLDSISDLKTLHYVVWQDNLKDIKNY
ncbi:MAG: hypothetical protein GXX80_00260 [Thermotogaceae bacterium]|nr:hypothetical protein [Thermotogaceae bacterium]